LRLELMADI